MELDSLMSMRIVGCWTGRTSCVLGCQDKVDTTMETGSEEHGSGIQEHKPVGLHGSV